MTEYIDCTPHPAINLGYTIVEAMKREGFAFDYEGSALIAAAGVLMTAERKGAVVFTDEPTPRYETSRPMTSAEQQATDALKELVGAIAASEEVSDRIFTDAALTGPDFAERRRIREAIAAAERVLGY